MNNPLLLGLWRLTVSVPPRLWQAVISKQARDAVASLGFMSEDHHRVRDFAVRELPCVDQPLDRVNALLDELEQRMTFLFRGDGEAVTWAYPVTVDRTPHHVTFSSGETCYAA